MNRYRFKSEHRIPMSKDYALETINADWQAVHNATLIFVMHQGKVLLIRKKRGLGAGKINGPGGKTEGSETAQACAHRELEEELRISVDTSENRGRLRFQFIDGYSLDVRVFVATSYSGEPTETDEACLLYTSPSPRDRTRSRMPSSA